MTMIFMFSRGWILLSVTIRPFIQGYQGSCVRSRRIYRINGFLNFIIFGNHHHILIYDQILFNSSDIPIIINSLCCANQQILAC